MKTLSEWMKLFDRKALDILYPPGITCICCGELSHGAFLCDACKTVLDGLELKVNICPVCGHPLNENESCSFCLEHESKLYARSVWQHAEAARRLVHALKFDAVENAADVMAEKMAEYAVELIKADPHTVITWVPMPKTRKRERGIDHGKILAEKTAERLELRAEQLLRRSDERQRTTQAGLDKAQRLKNAEKAFELCKCIVPEHILLVDDVLTSGSTAIACIDCLLQGGAKDVAVVTATQAIKY